MFTFFAKAQNTSSPNFLLLRNYAYSNSYQSEIKTRLRFDYRNRYSNFRNAINTRQ